MKKNIFVLLVLLAVIFVGCNDYKIGPHDSDTTPPGTVTDVAFESLPGKVKLTYKLPADQNLMYVKAVYTLNSGVVREVSSSFYTNSMVLEGFGDTEPHEVKIYAISRSNVESEPVTIEVVALENPIWDVYRSLIVSDEFSGVKIKALNESMENVSIEMMVKDTLGKWVDYESIETRAKNIEVVRRGLRPVEQEMRVTVRDRFMNYTDVRYQTVHPMYEEELDKTIFKKINLPDDGPLNHQELTKTERLWDNVYGNDDAWRFATNDWNDAVHSNKSPQYVSFDTGVMSRLTHITIFNWGVDSYDQTNRHYYVDGHLRKFEVWGWPHPGTPLPDMDQWTKLGEFEIIKPSGLPYMEESQDDRLKAQEGFEFVFPDIHNMPRVQYVRIKCIENFMGTTKLDIKEMDLFGDPREETNE